MASLRGTITVLQLESFTGEDYSAVDTNDPLTDDDIEKMAITPGELDIEGMTGVTLSSLSDEALKLGVKKVAKKYMDNWIVEHGYEPDNKDRVFHPPSEFNAMSPDLIDLVDTYRQKSHPERKCWIW